MIDCSQHGCFDTVDATYRNSQTVPRHPLCYGYIFINKGDTGVLINGTFLKPFPPGRPDLSGESYSYVDAGGRLYTRDFLIIFDSLPGVDPRVEIHQVHHNA